MFKISISLFAILIFMGCARVRVEAPKEPIKVDISMRLDIYQHIQKDIDAIEGIVSGAGKQSRLGGIFLGTAYAQEELSAQLQDAASRRKQRKQELDNWFIQGVIGENKSGFVELRINEKKDDAVTLIKAENDDRMLIYQELAKKNNTTLEEIERIYAEKLQKNAPAQAPVEAKNESTGSFEWKIK